MNTNKLLVELNDGLLTLILNNPSKLNCMGFAMLYQLNDAICEAEMNEEVRVVMVKGAGDKAFSSGADLNEFNNLKTEDEVRWIEFGNSVFNKIESLNKPTVAFIDGYAIGGGLELALACDFRVGTPKASVSSPELQHGWLPGWGGMTRLRRLFGESIAKEIIFLCEKIDAEKALQLGILNRVVESETSEEFTILTGQLKAINLSAFGLAKAAINDKFRTTLGADVKFDVLAMQLAQQVKK